MGKPGKFTLVLIIINVVLFIPELLPIEFGGYEFTFWLAATGDSLARPWELVTAMFGHWSIDHLLMNMISLYWLGTMIEDVHGPVKFGIIYFVSGIAGNLAVVLFAPDTLGAGASGAIFGLLGAAALLLYNLRADPGANAMLKGLLAMLALNVVNSFLPGISMAAHLGGLVAGVACEAVIIALDRARALRPRS